MNLYKDKRKLKRMIKNFYEALDERETYAKENNLKLEWYEGGWGYSEPEPEPEPQDDERKNPFDEHDERSQQIN
jgi:hypothetical protein